MTDKTKAETSRPPDASQEFDPQHERLDAFVEGPAPMAYIAYPKAMQILREKWNATPDELAVWIFMGPDEAGIAAYRNANELIPPQRVYFDFSMGEDYRQTLVACWFLQEDIDRFTPADRYITGAALIERWGIQPDLDSEAFIRAKIAESRLLDIHPTFGGTKGTFGDDAGFPPLSAALFAMSHIKLIEAEDSISPRIWPNDDDEPVKDGVAKKDNDEPPLMGRKAIASYLNVSESTVKNYLKQKSFPFFSQGGRKCAWPSGLDAWRTRKKK